MSSTDPLTELLSELAEQLASASEPALRRAFAEGYRKGMADARDNIAELLSAKASEQMPAILGANSVPEQSEWGGVRRSPPLRGVVNNNRRYAYGSVIGAFRKALHAHSAEGITREGIRRWVNKHFDIEVTSNAARETLKRLSRDNEAYFKDGVWWPGEEIKASEDTEPPSGDPAGGSEGGSLFGAQSRH